MGRASVEDAVGRLRKCPGVLSLGLTTVAHSLAVRAPEHVRLHLESDRLAHVSVLHVEGVGLAEIDVGTAFTFVLHVGREGWLADSARIIELHNQIGTRPDTIRFTHNSGLIASKAKNAFDGRVETSRVGDGPEPELLDASIEAQANLGRFHLTLQF